MNYRRFFIYLIFMALINISFSQAFAQIESKQLTCVSTRDQIYSISLYDKYLFLNNNSFLYRDDFAKNVPFDRVLFSLFNNDDLDILVSKDLMMSLKLNLKVEQTQIVIIDNQSETSESLMCFE